MIVPVREISIFKKCEIVNLNVLLPDILERAENILYFSSYFVIRF